MVDVASNPSSIRLSAAMIRLQPCEDPSRRTPSTVTEAEKGQIVQRNRVKLELARLRVVDTIE